MELKESNMLLKLKILVNLLSNGQPKKLSYVTKTWEESELTFWMSPYTLMLSTEEVVKLSQLQEESIMLPNLLQIQDYKNLSSKLKLPVQLMLWEESTPSWIKEEESSTKKNKSVEPHLTSSEHSYLSVNLSVSPLH
jgi:hypothetical protein